MSDYGLWNSALTKTPPVNLSFIVLFSIFLYPYSTSAFGNDGISINYLFIFFPVVFALFSGKILLPGKSFILVIILYVLIFVMATAYQYSYAEFAGRRLISFIIFMSIFSYIFIRIDSTMVASFKSAVIVISLFFSLVSLYKYFSLEGHVLGFSAKDVIGSQRFGYVYVLAIVLLLEYRTSTKLSGFLKMVGLLTLQLGLLLTFSRSGIVAILAVAGLYIGIKTLKRIMKHTQLETGVILNIALIGIVYILLLYLTLPDVFEFYFQNLFSLTQPTGLPTFVLASDPATSEGFRIFMFQQVMEFISNNPFTGAGYLGVWILSESHSGSAHVQMIDVLFRTGILGFIAYVFLIYKLLRFLYERESGLFFGLIGILVYGVFHETFKDSQGGFILAFLMGMMAQFKTSVVKADDSRH